MKQNAKHRTADEPHRTYIPNQRWKTSTYEVVMDCLRVESRLKTIENSTLVLITNENGFVKLFTKFNKTTLQCFYHTLIC